MVATVALALATGLSGQTAEPRWTLQDAFGRDVGERGVTLVDWEGFIANPAIRYRIVPGERFYKPARINLSADGGRLMFNLHSDIAPDGPSKTMFFERDDESIEFWMSTAPDRDFADEEYELTIEIIGANKLKMVQKVSVRVIDQDRDRPLDFHVTKDFSHDQTGFFDDPLIRRISETAVDDWAYFMADQGFDPVPAGSENSWIWEPTGFVEGHEVTNDDEYTGFKLYFMGIDHEAGRAGAEASRLGEEQTRDGVKTGLRRSGSVMMDITGNWNHLGWTVNLDDDKWHATTNMRYELHDYYSIVQHEMRHSFVYHRVIRAFDEKIVDHTFYDGPLREYYGDDPVLLDVEHFGGFIDPVSKKGAMGNEYGGDMPRARWILTKFDLLVAQAVGYRLRPTTPFHRLATTSGSLDLRPTVGKPFSYPLGASGGIPTYDFVIEHGALPTGLALDRWTGVISGDPEESGDYRARIAVTDNDPTGDPMYITVAMVVEDSF